ncbi:hypothetical protein [Chryseobacterium sp.]|uniref:hypothetical protein n=1 Tax=Chryseobacterium sp. TaxID=1871047 RepID=UPI00262AA20F|nr:hypothetical protein [Chryseobacterium sp.]
MSKKKQLIHAVFERIKEGSEKNTKNGWASELVDYFEANLNFVISKKTLVRYYEAYIDGDEDIDIELFILNRLSQYLNFDDYDEFAKTIEKRGEDACKTTIKIDVDNEDTSLAGSGPNVTVNITNTNSNDNNQHFKVPDFIKQNGMGIMEMALILFLVTGNVLFSNSKKQENTNSLFQLGFMSNPKSEVEKKYMYWNGERFLATDSNYISPEFELVAMDEHKFRYLKKITRKDTMTIMNSLGRTWYSKFNGKVEFFTADGVDPDNKKELRKSSPFIIYKYSGQ